MIALLGRQDFPTDGVEDYCNYLGQALGRRGVQLTISRVDWTKTGWLRALWKLRRESARWGDAWVLLQYTALGWSRRGLPFGAVLALIALRRQGKRCAVVFHEPVALKGIRWIDKLRAACQNLVLRQLHRHSEKSIMTVPLESVDWLPKGGGKTAFIPIGANIPEPLAIRAQGPAKNGKKMTVAVYCVDPPPYRAKQLDDIAQAVLPAVKNGTPLRVLFLGKGTVEARDEIERKFRGTGVEASILGIVEPEEIRRSLSESEALLSVRGTVYPRRGSAITGVACGLPIVGYTDGSDIFPLSEAGLRLAPRGDQAALAKALGEVLRDSRLRGELGTRSRCAYKQIFSWDVIAAKYADLLHTEGMQI